MTLPTIVTKAHATGNDFIVYADPEGRYEPSEQETQWACDRHFGVGGDGLLRFTHPEYVRDLSDEQREACSREGAVWFMDYRNADGSLAEMCGNGTRAITLFAQRRRLVDIRRGQSLRLGTRTGVKTLTALGSVSGLGEDVFRVSMGQWHRGEIGEYEVMIPGTNGSACATFVDMGNPHVVAVIGFGCNKPSHDADAGTVADAYPVLCAQLESSSLPALDMLDVARKPVVYPRIETDQNVEFVEVNSCDPHMNTGCARMRVNERGVGETLSCGTGLCATGVTLRSITGIDHWTIDIRGGRVRVDISDTNVELTGSAVIVGTVNLA
jgi:diaminopimelate epimerase